jgi:L-threonylcarbamoyladenylate synthase
MKADQTLPAFGHLPLTGQATKKLSITKSAEIIKDGGLVVYPSDTVYILAVDPTNQKATDKLLAFKNRWTGKAISIAVADKKMAMEYVELSDSAENIYKNLLPGPFTIVSKGKHKVANGIEAENGTLGIRIPDSQWIAELVKEVGGPVTATSANLSGRTPHYSLDSFLKTLSKKKLMMIDGMVDGGKLPNNKPSTVIDTTDPEIKILRRGDLIVGKSQILISKSEKETEKVAEYLINKIYNFQKNNFQTNIKKQVSSQRPIVFGLSGDLGCGKTVFSRKIGQILGVKEKITSPTFVIYNEYLITKNKSTSSKQVPNNNFQVTKFVHYDLYRLGEKYEFEEIDFLNNFVTSAESDLVACIEWPENMGEDYLEKLKKMTNYVPINFRYVDEKTREIEFT